MSLTTSRTAIDEDETVATGSDGRQLGSVSDIVDSDPLDALCQSVETGTSQPSTRAAFVSAGREVCSRKTGSVRAARTWFRRKQ